MYSRISVLVLALVLAALTFSRPVNGSMNWDVTGYYFYLPAIFIYHDIELNDVSWAENLRSKYDLSGTLYQFHPVEGRSNYVDQYTCGMAVMYAPAFFVGHLIAKITGAEADGFSWPYQWSMVAWSFLIALLGILFLRKVLMFFFTDLQTALILFSIIGATNYLIQVSRGLTTPHNFLFTLYALFLWAVIQWHQTKSKRWWYAMAVFLGLMSLSRPTEFLAILLSLFWCCKSLKEVWAKIKGLWQLERSSMIGFAVVLLALAMPQFIYWKWTTGHWFFMSYTNPGEGFDFLSPHTIDFLFSFRKGWFIYTPLMAFAMLGFIFLWKKRRELFFPIFIFFVINLFLISSWSCWWYAQCFSQRAMVQTLPVTALLLGFSFLFVKELKLRSVFGTKIIQAFFRFLFLAFFSLTILYEYQYENNVLDQWRMTKEYFFAVFGRLVPNENAKQYLLIDRPFNGEMIWRNKELYKETAYYSYRSLFPNEMDNSVELDGQSMQVEKLNRKSEFTLPLKKEFKELTEKDHVWIKASADVWLPDSTKFDDILLVCTAEHKGIYGYRTVGVNPDSLRWNAWNHLSIDYLSPEVRTKRDHLSFYIWYRGKDSVYVRDFDIRIFERK